MARPGLVKSAEGPLAAVLTGDALYVVGLKRITPDNVNHSLTPTARRIRLDQPGRTISASVEIGSARGEIRETLWRFEFAHETLTARADEGPDIGFLRAIASRLGWQFQWTLPTLGIHGVECWAGVISPPAAG